jgi:broad specificity phosphatase PhoE
MPPVSLTTINFVRHGTVHNPGELFYGRLPRFGLSAAGFLQAQKAANFFADKTVSAIVSSPMLRARQTARIIAKSLPQKPAITISALLNEVYTPFDGHAISELDRLNWDIYTGSQSPYEQPADVFKRIYRFLQIFRKRYDGQQIVVVTHADVIVFLSLWANGYGVNFQNKSLVEHKQIALKFPAPASVTSFTWQLGQDVPEFGYFGD